MPRPVRLYIKNVIIGFLLAAVFVALLLWANVGNLWHLISTSDIGWIAVVMLVIFNGIVFAGVQFGIVIMRMGHDDTPSGGKRQQPPLIVEHATIPVPVDR
ncbi:hypothetical protein [Aliiroseovarius sp. YM-037]|uniref:hypothetical protein n=1 Tax=Aliiroseovarius sp. YM-037 TaxID=3341728 RepID=UPI003A7FC397